ncbi:hypothetical protein GGTG_08852 [Gaeumannomyces tritici R3-111a-1]|uniref:Uncharacterized protein n=1 Tax=Gaeumannomyces tritici (strain R3-111a-1) TaxID=644352 RepID=J3P5R2_GAET3|nr:hypothetical protein GGTG_08852 [Gaeumannomyces tritici R3-111a-1]EJT75014.1 hypothetical protein GGTG_08852 [Gaeumannomyces tritici R3-111a-1]
MARRGPAKPARPKASASRPLPTSRPTPAPALIASTPTPPPPADTSAPSEGDISKHFVRIGGADDLSLEGLRISDSDKQLESKKGKLPQKPFRFLDLPAELRVKVYGFYFAETLKGKALDLEPGNYKRIHTRLGTILRTCRIVYEEVFHFFFSAHVFRLFPTHYGGRFFKTKKPLLARMAPRQRACITTLELRVGPGWSKPPRGWVVNPALGLRDCVAVRRLKVFVEFDPGHPVFSEWRHSDGFYEGFCRSLLDGVLNDTPALDVVEFDSFPSIKLSGDMMQGLLSTALAHGKQIAFGPARGWKSIHDDADEPYVDVAESELQSIAAVAAIS